MSTMTKDECPAVPVTGGAGDCPATNGGSTLLTPETSLLEGSDVPSVGTMIKGAAVEDKHAMMSSTVQQTPTSPRADMDGQSNNDQPDVECNSDEPAAPPSSLPDPPEDVKSAIQTMAKIDLNADEPDAHSDPSNTSMVPDDSKPDVAADPPELFSPSSSDAPCPPPANIPPPPPVSTNNHGQMQSVPSPPPVVPPFTTPLADGAVLVTGEVLSAIKKLTDVICSQSDPSSTSQAATDRLAPLMTSIGVTPSTTLHECLPSMTFASSIASSNAPTAEVITPRSDASTTTDAAEVPPQPPTHIRPERLLSLAMNEVSRSSSPPPAPRQLSTFRTPASKVPTPRSVPSSTPRSARDYVFYREIGNGTFGAVFHCFDVIKQCEVAVKQCSRAKITKENKAEYVMREKRALRLTNERPHPGIIELYDTFKDEDHLYFVTSYATRGDFQSILNRFGCLTREAAQFYVAELLSVLEYLHFRLPGGFSLVHRDLKPGNLLLKADWHLCVCDFGCVKIYDGSHNPVECDPNPQPQVPPTDGSDEDEDGAPMGHRGGLYRTKSFVGTASYVSPEVLLGQTTTTEADLWSLGVVAFQLVTGKMAFSGDNELIIMQYIRDRKMAAFPDWTPDDARDLVNRLVVSDASSRLGATDEGNYETIKSHPFFQDIEWELLYDTEPPAQLVSEEATRRTSISPLDNQFIFGSRTFLPEENNGPTQNVDPWAEFHAVSPRDVNWRMLEPGLDEDVKTRLFMQSNIDLYGVPRSMSESTVDSTANILTFFQLTPEQQLARLSEQVNNPYHRFASNRYILRQGILSKKVGWFTRKRMFILTEGPALVYVDPNTMEMKGEVPWSKDLRPKIVHFNQFQIQTPTRTYQLKDDDNQAMEWVRDITALWEHYYGGRR